LKENKTRTFLKLSQNKTTRNGKVEEESEKKRVNSGKRNL